MNPETCDCADSALVQAVQAAQGDWSTAFMIVGCALAAAWAIRSVFQSL